MYPKGQQRKITVLLCWWSAQAPEPEALLFPPRRATQQPAAAGGPPGTPPPQRRAGRATQLCSPSSAARAKKLPHGRRPLLLSNKCRQQAGRQRSTWRCHCAPRPRAAAAAAGLPCCLLFVYLNRLLLPLLHTCYFFPAACRRPSSGLLPPPFITRVVGAGGRCDTGCCWLLSPPKEATSRDALRSRRLLPLPQRSAGVRLRRRRRDAARGCERVPASPSSSSGTCYCLLLRLVVLLLPPSLPQNRRPAPSPPAGALVLLRLVPLRVSLRPAGFSPRANAVALLPVQPPAACLWRGGISSTPPQLPGSGKRRSAMHSARPRGGAHHPLLYLYRPPPWTAAVDGANM